MTRPLFTLLLLALALPLLPGRAHAQVSGLLIPIEDKASFLPAFAFATDIDALSSGSVVFSMSYVNARLQADPNNPQTSSSSTGEATALLKYSPMGTFEQTVLNLDVPTRNSPERINGIYVTPGDGMYVAGTIASDQNVDFDPGPGVQNRRVINSSGGAGFGAGYGLGPSFGVFRMAKTFQGPGSNNRIVFFDTAVQSTNASVYVGRQLDNPNQCQSNNSQCNLKPLIAGYSSNGTPITIGGFVDAVNASSSGEYRAAAVDAQDNLYALGDFQGRLNFGIGPGGVGGVDGSLQSAGNSRDIVLVSYTPTGAFRWARRIGSSFDDRGRALVVDGGTVYVGGYIGADASITTETSGTPSLGTVLSASPARTGVAIAFNTSGAVLPGQSYRVESLGGGTNNAYVRGLDYQSGGQLALAGTLGGLTTNVLPAFSTPSSTPPGSGIARSRTTGTDGFAFLLSPAAGTYDRGFTVAASGDDEVVAIALGNGTAHFVGSSPGSAPIQVFDGTATQELTLARGTNTGGRDAFLVNLGTISLPVELSAFDAQADGQTARLMWATAGETDNDGFAVEHEGGAGWSSIGWVGGAGTTLEAQRYAFTTPALPAGTHRFRLRQVDLDGAENLSHVVEVTIARGRAALTVAPNPSRGEARVRVALPSDQQVRVALYDALGRERAVLFEGRAEADAPLVCALPEGLGAGVYAVRLEGERATQTTSVVVLR